MERLTLQQMIDNVLQQADSSMMSKLAEEAKDDDEEKKRPRKEDVERQADKEEAHRGGGMNDTDYSKTASERVEKLAAAVDEIVAHFSKHAETASEASANVGPGKGPGALPTNLGNPVGGEQPEPAGQAKTQIALKPGTEAGANPKNPSNQMETNEDTMHPAYPKDGVEKQATPLDGLVSLLAKSAAAPGTGERYQDPSTTLDPETYRQQALKSVPGPVAAPVIGGLGLGALGAATGGAIGAGMGHPGIGAAIGGAVGGAGGAALGHYGRKGAIENLQNMHPELLDAMATHETASRLHEEGRISDEQMRQTENYLADMMAKHGSDAEGGEGGAKITAPTDRSLPEDEASKMSRPGEVTGQERHLDSNEAAINAKKDELKAPVRRRIAEVLAEPALTSSTDPVLDQALGAGTVNEAGAKIAAEARAYFAKVASEGCSCGSEKGSCRHCVVAAVLRKTAQKVEG
jgi:hypothetical protein